MTLREALPELVAICHYLVVSSDVFAEERRLVMKVGFIGAGSVTGTFGRHLINAGHTIVVSNSRGPATLAGFVADLGPGAIAGTREEAAECDVIMLYCPFFVIILAHASGWSSPRSRNSGET